MPRVRLPEYGVIGVEGLPGSGKSYFLTRNIISIILEQRRPVYTNCPLKWRVIRQYLRTRGGAECANLLHDLTKEHFIAFCERQKAREEFIAGARGFRDLRRSVASLGVQFVEQYGPDVLDQRAAMEAGYRSWLQGQGVSDTPERECQYTRLVRAGEVKAPVPNWIPGGAVIVIDEVHHWFPESQQRGKGEPAALQAYITMHRHHCHQVWWASQARMQVSLTFRRNTAYLWQVRNLREDRLAWGLKFKHLGISGFGYAKWSGDQLESRALENERPLDNDVILPWLPWNQVYFRLYSSFTHVASAAEIARQLRKAQADAGLVARHEVRPFVQKPKGSFMGRVGKVALLSGLFCTGCGVAYVAGGARAPEKPAESVVAEPVAPLEWPKLEGIGDGFIRAERGKVGEGEAMRNGALLVKASRKAGVAVLVARGDVFVWKLRAPVPNRLGTVDEVRASIHELAVQRFGGGPGEQAATEGGATGVGIEAGLGLRPGRGG